MKNSNCERKISIRHWKRTYFVLFTAVFTAVILLAYSRIFAQGRSFITSEDGWKQHFKALVYYSDWLQQIARTLFEKHRLVVPKWDASIGYGSDILTTLHYYVLGDPLTFFSILVPNRYLVHFYDFLFILRIYLAGLAFSCYCYGRGYRNQQGILAGSLIYVFCGYTWVAALRHPYFMNPLIYLPLLLLGVEKILARRRPYLFIIMTAVSALSNFYFFYMLVLLTVIYVLFRIVTLWPGWRLPWKEAGACLLHLAGYALVGLCMSAVLFLPVVNMFLGDGRSSAEYGFSLFYPLHYYRQYLSMYLYQFRGVQGENWTYLAYSSLSLPPLVLLFLQNGRSDGSLENRRNRSLKAGVILLNLFLLCPLAGRLFNGFSYQANRWIWGYGMLIAFITVVMWEKLFVAKGKTLWILAAVLFFYGDVAITTSNQGAWYVLVSVLLSLFAVAGIGLSRLDHPFVKKICKILHGRKQGLEKAFVFGIILTIAMSSWVAYGKYGEYSVKPLMKISEVNREFYENEGKAVLQTAGADSTSSDAFYRYSGTDQAMTANTAMFHGLSSTGYYFSMDNGAITRFRSDLDLRTNSAYNYLNLDGRTFLNALASVKYFVTTDQEGQENQVPFGYVREKSSAPSATVFSPEKGTQNLRVYRNTQALPLGYTYSSCMTREMFDQLSASEKQEALLQSVLLEGEGAEALAKNSRSPVRTSSARPVSLRSDKITWEGSPESGLVFYVKKGKTSVTLDLQGEKDAETSLVLGHLQYQPKKSNRDKTRMNLTIQAYEGDACVQSKKLLYYTNKNAKYNNRHDFLVNLGYSREAKNRITILFPYAGTWSLDSLEVVCQPMKNYQQQISALKAEPLEAVSFGENRITGQIQLKQSRILCISLPWSGGWSARVDGKQVPLYKANGMYMGLSLTPGTHQIQLCYETPGLKEGRIISLLGIVMFLLLVLYREIRQKTEKTDNNF